ncbi:hypothetical protein Cgig2_027461 [Carnegiea gigantea]|uniref:Uncharacterized protein n=1 Tax=Carnegiea gigantea TaxID=171969 RepID=A0A9Q1KPE4_9CARY|nr:hypothetical protein Cgig2_027461 [Carnegiea gigantea]
MHSRRPLPEDYHILCPCFSLPEAERAATDFELLEILQATFYAILLNEAVELGAVCGFMADGLKSSLMGPQKCLPLTLGQNFKLQKPREKPETRPPLPSSHSLIFIHLPSSPSSLITDILSTILHAPTTPNHLPHCSSSPSSLTSTKPHDYASKAKIEGRAEVKRGHKSSQRRIARFQFRLQRVMR